MFGVLQNNLRDDLFEALCKQGTPKDLLIESDSIADEREHSQAMLEA
jgi:hypothetical protein